MKRYLQESILSLFVFFVLICAPYAYAAYMLPYPSYMPGNTLYKVSRFFDTVGNYWHRGTIAQVKYHLRLSDKYLVESKTLFEYKQYLLGVDALQRSTKEFQMLPVFFRSGIQEGKDMTRFVQIIGDASEEHIRVLEAMKKESPEVFQWTPEKVSPSDLSLHSDIAKAIDMIKAVVGEIQK